MGLTLKQIAIGVLGITSSHIPALQATLDEAVKRLDVCKDCPSLKISVNNFTQVTTYKCGECGCYLKSKTKLKSSKCPLGKW